MKTYIINVLFCILATLCFFLSENVFANTPPVVELNQTHCQFLEPEQRDHKFKSSNPGNCRRINDKTKTDRLKNSKPLRIKAGKTIFRIKNNNVPYVLGFWLRGEGLQRVTLPSTSGGGITIGNSKDYEIDLKPGNYLVSCPLNPTPDYKLIVE